MTHKTIKIQGCKTCKEVHIFLDRNENGEDFVRILAWHNTKDGLTIQSAEADVFGLTNNILMMQRYIADFSEMSANEFALSMSF